MRARFELGHDRGARGERIEPRDLAYHTIQGGDAQAADQCQGALARGFERHWFECGFDLFLAFLASLVFSEHIAASGALARASISEMPPLPVPAPKFSVHSLLSRVAAAISVLNTRLFVTLPVST
jgi:hypothetical protein